MDAFYGIVGSHPSLQHLIEQLKCVASLEPGTTIMIQGESGTGKELIARAIHALGAPSNEPFLGVNCGSFSQTLLEDQLFGHRKGAFTGAETDKSGVFVAAGNGTLFLDEITEMPPELQVRLLRVIQEREVYPLGSDASVPVSARLVVATNRTIEKEVELGNFRRDLYYRINVIRLEMPPLRDRLSDIPQLSQHFLNEFAQRGGAQKTLSEEAQVALCNYSYPGNVRELRNILEQAWALAKQKEIQVEDLPSELRGVDQPKFRPLADIEREHILLALQLARGKKTRAAQYLQIDRNRLYRMIQRHGIQPEEIFKNN